MIVCNKRCDILGGGCAGAKENKRQKEKKHKDNRVVEWRICME